MMVWVNGRFMPLEQATISPMDRGFLFGDGVYEVIPVYDGRPFGLDEHLERLARSLEAIRLDLGAAAPDWRALITQLVAHNGGGNQAVYIQVTRGAPAVRGHGFPTGTEPTRVLMSWPITFGDADSLDDVEPVRAITLDDIRWQRCDIKSVSLLPNVLLKQQALDAGVEEAILLRDGRITEAAAANVMLVCDGTIVSPPTDHHILPGITRFWLQRLANREGVEWLERPVDACELATADEIWLSSSTRELVPVVELDGRPVADGVPGPLWRRLCGAYRRLRDASLD